jgi:primosomal protein N' (replication factor Y)
VRQRRELRLRVADQARAESEVTELETRAPRQAGCLRYLLARPEGSSRRDLVDAGFAGALAALCGRGLLERFDGAAPRDPLAHIRSAPPEPLVPTPDQRQVIADLTAALESGRFFPALLHGVTGSGKTLVYLDLAARALTLGRGTVVLVPEIALAWQMVRRFHAHFGEQVAVLHSQLSTGERYDTWLRLRQGEQRIIIGARSAVLAPVQDLGLLIVDEEHDASYKQEDLDSHHPFAYNARDLALVRGQRRQALVLLGSATPSLESYWNARTGKYHLFTLPRRVDDRPLARVSVVDLRREPGHRKKRVIFSRELRLKMRERLERGEQIVLLQNRRGFAPFILCGACGEAVQCGSCRVSTTYHRGPHPEMRCHYCDYRAPVPPACPSCGSAELRFEGIGTQKVETALEEQFPGVRVIRMDVDTTGWKGAHDELVERFRQRQADVLLGTQMVAKGLDFPEVTLVGVISADTGMHLPDFRAAERSFQLLTQVAGRSGRGAVPGEVVIQTSLPDDPVLQTAAAQDYAAFAERELEERQPAGFPPFGRLVVFRWRGRNEGAVTASAERGVACLRQVCEADQALLGPAAAPLALLRGEHRWQALLRGGSPPRLHAVTAAALTRMRAGCDGGVSLTVNVDPLTMM